jgi:hypothetical protein
MNSYDHNCVDCYVDFMGYGLLWSILMRCFACELAMWKLRRQTLPVTSMFSTQAFLAHETILSMETIGFEPITLCLQSICSTTKLCPLIPHFMTITVNTVITIIVIIIIIIIMTNVVELMSVFHDPG